MQKILQPVFSYVPVRRNLEISFTAPFVLPCQCHRLAMLWSGMADRVYVSPAYDLSFSWVFRENATALGHDRRTRPEQFKLC